MEEELGTEVEASSSLVIREAEKSIVPLMHFIFSMMKASIIEFSLQNEGP